MIKKLSPILLLSFVNVLGFSLLIPVIPEVLQFFTGVSRGFLYGLFLTAYALSQFFAAPYFGRLSDRFGRRPLLLLSQTGTLLSRVIFALAYFIPKDAAFFGLSLPLLVIAVSRVLDGLTGGNISVAQAYVSDRTSSEEKTKAFGLVGAVFGIGFLIGPALGGLSVSTSIHFLGTCILAFFVSLVTLLWIYFGLPESLPKSKRSREKPPLTAMFTTFLRLKDLFAYKHIKKLIPLRMAYSVVFVAFTTAVILFLDGFYGLSPVQTGLILSCIGVFSIFNQAFAVPKISQKIGPKNAFFMGLVISSLSLVFLTAIAFFFPPSFSGVVILLFFLQSYPLNLGLSLAMTTFKALLAIHVEDEKQGEAMGMDEAISSFGQAVSPFLAGIVYDLIEFYSFAVYGIVLLIFISLSKQNNVQR